MCHCFKGKVFVLLNNGLNKTNNNVVFLLRRWNILKCHNGGHFLLRVGGRERPSPRAAVETGHAYETAFSCTAWTSCDQPAYFSGSETEHSISLLLLHYSCAELLDRCHFCSHLACLECLNPVHSFSLTVGSLDEWTLTE